MAPKVSIKCLAYNHGPYIRAALEGFVSQKTNFPFEVIVHDDASTDDTANIIREYAARYPDIIKPIFRAQNQHARYYEVVEPEIAARLTGEYICLCEGDDFYTDPDKLQRQADWLDAHRECNLVYGRVERYDQAKARIADTWGGPSETFDSLLIGNTVPTPSTMFRGEAYHRYRREINPGIRGWRMGDYPMWLYFAATGTVHFEPRTVACYRILPHSASHPDTWRKWLGFQESYRDIKLWFLNYYKADESLRLPIETEHVKLLVRQRVIAEPALQPAASEAIARLECGVLRKSVFRFINSTRLGRLMFRGVTALREHRR